MPPLWKHTDPREVGRQVFGALTALGAQCQAGGGQQEVSALVAAWAARYGLAAGSPVLWPVWTPLAVGLTSGAWPVDMSAWIHQGEHSVAPSAPSLAARRLQSRMPFCLMPPVDLPGAAPAVWRARKGSVQGYTGAHLVACVRACRQIGRLSKLKEAIDDAYNFLNPSRRRGRVASRMERSSTDVASKDTLARAVVRLDQAAMLWRRKSWRRDGPVFRHIAFDASPQHGQEVFVTVERVTARVALVGCRWDSLPPVEERSLPVVVLGKGRQGVAEKAQAFVHQTWLEYGPSRAAVREALASVRTVLTDMGAEAGIVDCRDLVDECLGALGPHGAPAGDALALVAYQPGLVARDAFLLPNAFHIPGPQHLLNTVLERSLESEPWWHGFQCDLKAVAQWVHPVANRRLLNRRLELT